MCKHILNAQVSIRAPCCKKSFEHVEMTNCCRWFDCAECHTEASQHPLLKQDEMSFICKKCKKAFRKHVYDFEDEADEVTCVKCTFRKLILKYCPHCDNHFLLEAKVPKPVLGIEGDDIRKDNRMYKDTRMRTGPSRSLLPHERDFSDVLG